MKKLFVLLIAMLSLSVPVHAKFMNLSADVLGLALGVGNIALDVRVSESLTIGGMYAIIDDDDAGVTQEGNSIGGRIRYHFGKALEDGWALTGFYSSFDTDIASSITFLGTTISSAGTAEGTAIGAEIGYGWFWSTLNTHLGVGFANYDADVTVTSGSSTLVAPLDGGVLVLDFSIGLAF